MLGRDGRVDRVGLGVRRRAAVARRVGRGDAGLDGEVGIGHQVAPATLMQKVLPADRAGVGRAVHRQGDGVAVLRRRRRPCR